MVKQLSFFVKSHSASPYLDVKDAVDLAAAVACCVCGSEHKRLMEDHKQEVDTLQRKVSELQAEYKLELKKAKDLSEVGPLF